MTILPLNSRTIEVLAERYAQSLRQRTRPVSMSAAIRAIRTVAPDLTLSDRELADIVAACAVQYGHVIDFDGNGSISMLKKVCRG